MSKIIEVNGIDVHIEGQGDTLMLMIHGWPDTYRLWDKQVDFFKTQYQIARFTLPGFDASKGKRPMPMRQIVDIITHITDAVSPNKPVVLMLHDWGCVFGYSFYQQHPHRVQKLIGLDIGDAFSPAHLKGLKLVEMAMIVAYQSTLAMMWQLSGGVGTLVTKGVAKGLGYPMAMKQINVGMNYPYAMAMFQRYGGLGKITPIEPQCPFYYGYAKKKPLMFHSQPWLNAIATNPCNQVHGYDAGHWLMIEQADLLNANVAAWLAKN